MEEFTSDELRDLWKHRGSSNYEYKGFLNDISSGRMVRFQDTSQNKELVGKLVKHPDIGEMFYWSRFSHVNLVPLQDMFDLNNETKIFIMPKFDSTLHDCIRQEDFYINRNSYYRKKSYLADILRGLDYLHHKNLCLMNLSDKHIFMDKWSDRAVIGNFSCITPYPKVTPGSFKISEIFWPPEFQKLSSHSFVEAGSSEIWMCGVLAIHIFCCDFLQNTLPVSFDDSDIGLEVIKFIENLNCSSLLNTNVRSEISDNEAENLKIFLKKIMHNEPECRIDINKAATDIYFDDSIRICDSIGTSNILTEKEEKTEKQSFSNINPFAFSNWTNKRSYDSETSLSTKTSSKSESLSSRSSVKCESLEDICNKCVTEDLNLPRLLNTSFPVLKTDADDDDDSINKNVHIESNVFLKNNTDLNKMHTNTSKDILIEELVGDLNDITICELVDKDIDQPDVEEVLSNSENQVQYNDEIVDITNNIVDENDSTEDSIEESIEGDLNYVKELCGNFTDEMCSTEKSFCEEGSSVIPDYSSAFNRDIFKPSIFSYLDEVGYSTAPFQMNEINDDKHYGDNIDSSIPAKRSPSVKSVESSHILNEKCVVESKVYNDENHSSSNSPDFIINEHYCFNPYVEEIVGGDMGDTDRINTAAVTLCLKTNSHKDTFTIGMPDGKNNEIENTRHAMVSSYTVKANEIEERDLSCGSTNIDKQNVYTPDSLDNLTSEPYYPNFMKENQQKLEIAIEGTEKSEKICQPDGSKLLEGNTIIPEEHIKYDALQKHINSNIQHSSKNRVFKTSKKLRKRKKKKRFCVIL